MITSIEYGSEYGQWGHHCCPEAYLGPCQTSMRSTIDVWQGLE